MEVIRRYATSLGLETGPGLSKNHVGTDDLQRSITPKPSVVLAPKGAMTQENSRS